MGIIECLICGAIGYVISEASKSHPLRDFINRRIKQSKMYRMTLEDIIEEYAKSNGIYSRDSALAQRLHRIARRYE